MKRIAILLAVSFAALAQQPDIQQVKLPHGIYYQSGSKRIRLTFIRYTGTHVKHGAAAIVGVVPSATVDFPGATSPNLIEDRRPSFTIDLDESQADDVRSLTIARLAIKKDRRELTMMHGGFLKASSGSNSKDMVDSKLTSNGNTYTLTPNGDLEPDEYLIFFNGAHKGGGYDFTVR
jgi:hypothetical protein